MLILHSTKLTMGAWSSVLVCSDAVQYVKSFNPPLNSLFDSDYSLSSASYFTLSLYMRSEKFSSQPERNTICSVKEINFSPLIASNMTIFYLCLLCICPMPGLQIGWRVVVVAGLVPVWRHRPQFLPDKEAHSPHSPAAARSAAKKYNSVDWRNTINKK